MRNKTNVNLIVDTELMNQAEELFRLLGLDLETAFNMFLHQSIREGRIPFETSDYIQNAETNSAIIETMNLINDKNIKTYDVEEALVELKTN